MSVRGHIGAPVRIAAGHRMCPKYVPPLPGCCLLPVLLVRS